MGAAALGSWGAEGRCLRARWTCLPQLLVLPWLPNKPSPFSTASPSSSDQAFPGTKAPGCHGNGFQAPTAGFPIGWQSLQVKVTLGVTSRSQSWVQGPPGT